MVKSSLRNYKVNHEYDPQQVDLERTHLYKQG